MSLHIVSLVELAKQLPRVIILTTYIPAQENRLVRYIYKNICVIRRFNVSNSSICGEISL